jgi:asparagine synthase (glutamine-hydrolysing)
MCGLNAILAYGSNAEPVDATELIAVRDAMIPRGPDGAGAWIADDRRIGLAHRRLAIVDLTAAGDQPMTTSDGALRIVFNGEIYNHRELRQQLQAKGHRFVSGSDTEVLLHAYREYGRAMVAHLRGMFAFALWDEARRGLFLARDHFGIKPLYFHDDGRTFRAASQVKALLAGAGVDGRPEPAGHVGFFVWGSVPEPFTLYHNVFALPSGHSLWVDDNGARPPEKYFDAAEELTAAGDRIPDRAAMQEVVSAAVRDSVRHHLIADVPVAVFLSAGLDSSTLAAVAAGHSPNIAAVTLGFQEYAGTADDEVPLARAVARRYGCTHHVSHVTAEDFRESAGAILAAMDQPSIDGVNTWFVARAASRAGFKAALSGLGGDELLGGYPSFRQIPASVARLRAVAAVPALGRLLRRASAPVVKRLGSPKYAGLVEYGGSYGGAYLLRRALHMPWELSRLLDPDAAREGWLKLHPLLQMNGMVRGIATPHAKVSALETAFYMRNQLLRDADWAGMAHSLEIRTPLVDVALFRALAPFIASGNPPTKQHLAAAAPVQPLPDEILARRKTGFSIPVQDWLTGATGREARGLRRWGHDVYRALNESRPRPRKPTRILALVTDAFGGHGGIAQFNRDLLTAACADPEVSTVVAMPRLMRAASEAQPLKLRYLTGALHSVPRYIGAVLGTALAWRRFDLVVCGHINLLPLARVAQAITRGRLVLVVYGVEAWQPPPGRFSRHCVKSIDAVASISQVTLERFGSWVPLKGKRTFLLPNMIDLSAFTPGSGSAPLRDRLNLSNRTVLLTLGRLSSAERYKGVDEILELLPTLAASIPNVTYVVAGEGDDRARLMAKAQDLGVADRVEFTGYVPESEKVSLYRSADAYVMPSSGEGFGFVFLEAMACGIPVVASSVDGGREAVRDGLLGELVNPGDRSDVIAGILRAVKKPKGAPAGLEYFAPPFFTSRCHDVIRHMAGGEST